MSTGEIIGLVIFIEIVIGVALLLWSLINNHMYRSITEDQRNYDERIARQEREYRKIDSVEVVFRDGSSLVVEDAVSYSLEIDAYLINGKDGKSLAIIERREVTSIIIRRKEEAN